MAMQLFDQTFPIGKTSGERYGEFIHGYSMMTYIKKNNFTIPISYVFFLKRNWGKNYIAEEEMECISLRHNM